MDNQEKWDLRFLEMARLVASWSKDPSTCVGAVLVRPDRTVASVGYNGFPRGVSDSPELYENREEKYARVIHAEENAILNAKEPTRGYTLYVSTEPCDGCTARTIQSGVGRVVAYAASEELKTRWQKSFDRCQNMRDEAGIEYVVYLPRTQTA